MEHYDVSLAILLIKFCWSLDDVVYLKVNAQAKSGIELSAKAVETLKKINAPDYLLYNYFNKTLWDTVDELGKRLSFHLIILLISNFQAVKEC